MEAVGDAGHLLAHVVQGLGRAAFGGRHAFAEALGDTGDLGAQFLQRFGLAFVGAAQALLDAPGHAGNLSAHLLDGVGGAVLDRLNLLIQLLAQALDFLSHFQTQIADNRLRSGFALLQMADDLVKRRLQGAQGFGRTAAVRLGCAQLFGDAGLIGAHFAHRLLKPGGDLGLAGFGSVQAGGKGVQGVEHAIQAGVGDGGSRREESGRRRGALTLGRRGDRRRFGLGQFLTFADHLVQPLAQGHARAAREILGDLTSFRVNSLNGPGRA